MFANIKKMMWNCTETPTEGATLLVLDEQQIVTSQKVAGEQTEASDGTQTREEVPGGLWEGQKYNQRGTVGGLTDGNGEYRGRRVKGKRGTKGVHPERGMRKNGEHNFSLKIQQGRDGGRKEKRPKKMRRGKKGGDKRRGKGKSKKRNRGKKKKKGEEKGREERKQRIQTRGVNGLREKSEGSRGSFQLVTFQKPNPPRDT